MNVFSYSLKGIEKIIAYILNYFFSDIGDDFKNGSTGEYTCKNIDGYTTITNGKTDYKIDGKDIVIKCSYKKKTSSTE